MTYLKKHNIFFISLFLFIISTIILGFSTRAIQLDQKALDSANNLASIGIINNNSNAPAFYNLSGEITRREMLKVMMNISGKTKSKECKGDFKDLKSSDWGCYYAEKALDLGYISPNDNFRPDDKISKIESLKMIFSAKEINVNNTSDWREGYMKKAVDLGITDSFKDYNTSAKRGWIFINTNNLIRQEFKNENQADVTFISPKGEITDLSKNITVKFSKPVVSLTALDNQEKCPININPILKGKCVWITTSTFQFRPNEGFPIGAKYNIKIAVSDLQSKNFNISTPKFQIINTSNTYYVDKAILVAFNAPISIENFKENFEISGFKNSDLNIEYFSTPSIIEGEKNINKSIVSIFPKLGSWGYDKKYSYILKSGLKSLRGNISIGKDKKVSFTTSKLLLSSSPFIYIDKTKKYKDLTSNFRFSNNKNIITKENPNILFTFYKEIPLKKEFFSIKGYDFDIKYAKMLKNIDGENFIKDNKKSIILSIKNTKNIKNLGITINSSKINPNNKNINLNFNTKNKNSIINYKFINYKTSCLTIKNKLPYDISKYNKFDFGDSRKNISYISEINSYSNNEKCNYKKGQNKYLINTTLDPNKDYNLTIKKELLDLDNYGLIQDYSTSFKTGPALNEDKHFSLLDYRKLILAPEDLNPISVGITSTNINKLSVEVCNGDFDVLDTDYIKNSKCINKEVEINNTGFKKSLSVLKLQDIFGKSFSGRVISLNIGKITGDKTKYELNSNYNSLGGKIHFIRTNKSVVVKSSENGIIWLTNFKTGENLTASILKIESYIKSGLYSGFGRYAGEKLSYKGEVNFTSLENGLYDLDKFSGYLLITLKTGEKLLINSLYNGYYNDKAPSIYLTTSKPIYKPGETVKIKGVLRQRASIGYDLLNINNTINLIINNPNYKQLVNTKITNSKDSNFTYEYKLDREAKLGNYNINILGNTISFAVEEYEKPDFKVTTNSKKPYYIYGETPKIDIIGEYYLGNKLSNGEGQYSVNATDYNFTSNNNPGYIWGKAPVFWLYDSYLPFNNTVNLKYNKVFTLNNNGQVLVNIDTSKTTKNKIYTLSTTLTDPNTKKSISSSSSFKILKDNSFVGMKFDKFYYNLGDTAKIDFLNLDINEKRLKNKNIIIRVYKVEHKGGIENGGTQYGGTQYGGTQYGGTQGSPVRGGGGGGGLLGGGDGGKSNKDKLLFEKSLKTDSLGEASIDYKIKDYGELRFEIGLENGKFKSSKTYYVSASNLLVSNKDNHKLKITKNKDKYEVGDIAKFVIFSPVKNVKALITVEKANKIFYKKIIDISDLTTEFALPIKSEYISNFDLKVFIIQKASDNILPNYYSGKSSVLVSKEKIKLKVSVKTNKSSYLPSEGAKIDLIIKDSKGNPISGDALISITDESLFALKDNRLKVEDFFYSKQINNVGTSFSLNDLIKKPDFKKIKYNIGVVNETRVSFMGDAMVKSSFGLTSSSVKLKNNPSLLRSTKLAPATARVSLEKGRNNNNDKLKLRTNFKDLAYYNALVKVINGKASINIDKLPDNLTTWVVNGYIITKDTKIGSFNKKFKVQKELNLLPSIPRFFIYGDTLEITANVINNTSKKIDITSSLDITNAQILSKPDIKTLNANSSKLLIWKVKIDEYFKENNISDITIGVNSNKLSDRVKLSRKIIDYSTPEYSFTNGSTYLSGYEDKIFIPSMVNQSKGQLDISLGATILTNLLDNINYNFSISTYYNNFYSIVGMFKKVGVLKSLYGVVGERPHPNPLLIGEGTGKIDDFVRSKIEEIGSYQNSDGGMIAYKDCIAGSYLKNCSSFELTGDFLSAVSELKKAGYMVDENIVNKALSYYKRELESKINRFENMGDIYRNIDDFYKIIDYDNVFLKKYILSSRFINTNYNFSNIEKEKIILLLQKIDPSNFLIQKYIKELENNTKIEARGTLVPADNSGYNNLLSTSLGLRVFIPHPNPQKPHPNPLLIGEGTGKSVLEDLEVDKNLILENMVRWIMAQKGRNGDFGGDYNSYEVISAITDYIKYSGELKGVDFEAKGYLNGKELVSNKFDNNNKFIVKNSSFKLKDHLSFGEDNILKFEKTGSGKLYYDVGLRYFLPISKIRARDEGIIVKRDYYNYNEYRNAFKKDCIQPMWFGGYHRLYTSKIGFPGGYCRNIKVKNITSVKSGKKGDFLVGEIEIIIPSDRNNVIVNNFIPSGAEIVNINLNTASNDIKNISGNNNSNNYWSQSFSHIEARDDRLVLFANKLYAGTYKYTYVLKLNHKGIYHNRPAIAEEIKKPEIWGRTNGDLFEVR